VLQPMLSRGALVAAALTATALAMATSASAAPPTCTIAGPQPALVREAPQAPDNITADAWLGLACTGGEPVEIVVDQQPASGNLSNFTSGGAFLYVIRSPGFLGPDHFAVHAHTPSGDSATVAVDVLVTKDPEPGPACVKHGQTTSGIRSGEARPVTLLCPGAAAAQVVAGPNHGTAAPLPADGTGQPRFMVTTASGYVGGDWLLVRAVDGAGNATDPKLLPINVVDPASNRPPQCISPLLPFGTLEPITAPTEIATTCADPDGDALTFAITAPTQHGTVAVATTPERFFYTPAPNYAGTDSVGYDVSDGHGGVTANHTAFSVNTVPPVAPPAPLPLVTPAVKPPTLRSDAVVRLRDNAVRLRLTSSVAGKATIVLTVPKSTTKASFTRALRKGSTTIKLKLPKALRKAIARHSTTSLGLRATLKAKDGRTAKLTRTLRVSHR
jgi:hypothetical protein